MNADYIPLSQFLNEDRDPSVQVASVVGKTYSWSHFKLHVPALAEQILKIGRGRWLLHTENSYDFAVGLFGLWLSDSVAVLPPNIGQQTLNELGFEAKGVISDHLEVSKGLEILAPLSAPPVTEQPTLTLGRDSCLLELYTSGSTGQRTQIKKTLGNLEDELEGFEMFWGEMLGTSEIFGTVSHQHLYGLLFRVLWPMSAKRLFRAETYLTPNQLLAEMSKVKHSCLVSGPAHLKRMPDLIDFAELGSNCKVIFSSGGPLPSETSLTFTKHAQITPFELFGSTETGGIAWRQHTSKSEPVWKPFRNVDVRSKPPDGFLQVRSPFLSESDKEGWFTTGDLVEIIPSKGFLHRGRGDRVVKIEEKRLSLQDMENTLETHTLVESAKVFFKEPPPFLQRRPPLTAVLVLNKKTNKKQEKNTERKLIRNLRQFLSKTFDPVLLPRFWKFVDKIPTDPQGKITVEILRSLLDPAELMRDPQIVDKIKTVVKRSTVLSLKLKIPKNLIYCDGHFEGYPLVPGVTQVHWAAEFIKDLLPSIFKITAIESLKFHKPLLPGKNCCLELKYSTDNQKVSFRFDAEHQKMTSGQFIISLELNSQ